MFTRVFVPAAAVVTIATVATPIGTGLIALLFGIGSVAVVSEPILKEIDKNESAARVAVTNPASVQALAAYNRIRTGDMPIGVALEADILSVTLSPNAVVTFAGPTDCYRNDFVGVHVSNNRADWIFLGVGPRNTRVSFDKGVTSKVYMRITPLHHPLCSDSGRGPHGHYLVNEAGPLPVTAAVAAEVQHIAAHPWRPDEGR